MTPSTKKGRAIRVRPQTIRRHLSQQELESLQADAERMMGKRPALTGEMLKPPPRNSTEYNWAQNLLALRFGEAAEIWVQSKGPKLANVIIDDEGNTVCVDCAEE